MNAENSRAGSSLKTTEALGQSEAFLEFQEKLAMVASINRPVLLVGERGTGKELAASRLHYLSKRWQGPMVALNCSALSPTLIESELFGYERGAFTGATQGRRGRFEAADNGTLFLDEIGNIPMEVQEKILRVVEYGAFERVGSSVATEVDVRIIAATNADLVSMSQKGLFMQDLLDRLSFEVLFLPPLRERREDIMLLANHFAARMSYELNRSDIPQFSKEAVESLEGYSWPGNVRELKNLVERAVYRSESSIITEITFDPFKSPFTVLKSSDKEDDFESNLPDAISGTTANKSFEEAIDDLKINLIKEALKQARHNQKAAAEALRLSYHQFRGIYRKFKKEIES